MKISKYLCFLGALFSHTTQVVPAMLITVSESKFGTQRSNQKHPPPGKECCKYFARFGLCNAKRALHKPPRSPRMPCHPLDIAEISCSKALQAWKNAEHLAEVERQGSEVRANMFLGACGHIKGIRKAMASQSIANTLFYQVTNMLSLSSGNSNLMPAVARRKTGIFAHWSFSLALLQEGICHPSRKVLAKCHRRFQANIFRKL